MFSYQNLRKLSVILGLIVANPVSAAAFSHVAPFHSAMAESSSTAPTSDVVYRRFDHSQETQVPSALPPSQLGVKLQEFLLRLTRDEATVISLRDLNNQNRVLRTQDAVIGEMLDKKHASQGFDPIKENVVGHSSRILGQSITERIEVLTAFQRGLQFDMNLKTLFSSGGSSAPAATELRYGLVLKDIEPSSDSARQAAIGEFKPEDLAYAGQARVVWGIEPILRRPDQPMFAVSRPMTDYADPSKADTRGLFSTISLPEPDFTGRVTPKPSTEGLKDGIPPLHITIEQKQGYYWTEIHSKANFKKEYIKYGARLPFYKAAHVQQIFTEEFDSERTSICNLLGDAHKPIVNINYIHADERYSGDLYMVRNRWTVGLTAEAAPRSNPIADFGKGHGERYEVKIGTDF